MEFGSPEVVVGGGQPSGATVGVLVPKAAVDKDYGAARAEDKVGPAGQVAALEAVAQAERGDQLADDFLRLGVVAADAGHVLRAPLRC